jgi:hypothetical protein
VLPHSGMLPSGPGSCRPYRKNDQAWVEQKNGAVVMREKIRDLSIRRQMQLSLDEIAEQLNPLLRGWIAYYGQFSPSELHPLLCYVNQTLLAWAKRKFGASKCIRSARVTFFKSGLGKTRSFSYTGVSVRPVRLPDGSGVSREVHAPF